MYLISILYLFFLYLHCYLIISTYLSKIFLLILNLFSI
nr:MAG TPA: hypothetical protein [Caudoviricetes sp.]